MKPIFQEANLERLKALIGQTDELKPSQEVFNTVNTLGNGLKEYKDNEENKVLLYVTGLLILGLGGYLLWTTKEVWPLLFMVSWFGAFLFYKVSENGLIMDSLVQKSKITPETPIPKIEYLQSGIKLKKSRKEMLKVYLSVFLSSSIMMVHTIVAKDASIYLSMSLLVVAIILSYIFWISFYKNDIKTLNEVYDQLGQLKTKYLLDTSHVQNRYTQPLFQEEEE